ncbi:hypothetical protein C8R45DRAFT_991038, partial [Mycena sanguinolenta]
VSNALIFGTAVFACAPLLLTSTVYPLQYPLLGVRLLFSFYAAGLAGTLAAQHLFSRAYYHRRLRGSADDILRSHWPIIRLSVTLTDRHRGAVVHGHCKRVVLPAIILMVSTAAEEDVKFPPLSFWPRMQIASSDWVTLFTRLSIVVIFLAVAVGFTLGPFFMPSHHSALFDYLCFALRLILLFASPVLNRDTSEKTTIWDVTPTMQNAVILQCVMSN